MERFLQVIMVLALVLIGVSAALSIRAHILVWMYQPPMERLRRGPEEIEKLKERIKTLSDDEREAVLEALEPDIVKKVMALIAGAPEPKKEEPPEPAARKWWQL